MMAAIGLFGLMLLFFWFLPSLARKSPEEENRERWERARRNWANTEKALNHLNGHDTLPKPTSAQPMGDEPP